MRKLLKFFSNHFSFIKDRRGVVSVEFALIGAFIFPGMLVASITVTQILRMNMNIELSVEQFAQITSAQTGVTGANLKDYCSGVKKMLNPWPTSTYNIAIASVTRSSSSNVAMDWEVDYSCGSNAPAIGSTNAVNTALSNVPNTGDSALVIVGSYTFVPTLTGFTSAGVPLSQTIVIAPRGKYTITCTSC